MKKRISKPFKTKKSFKKIIALGVGARNLLETTPIKKSPKTDTSNVIAPNVRPQATWGDVLASSVHSMGRIVFNKVTNVIANKTGDFVLKAAGF